MCHLLVFETVLQALLPVYKNCHFLHRCLPTFITLLFQEFCSVAVVCHQEHPFHWMICLTQLCIGYRLTSLLVYSLPGGRSNLMSIKI